MTNAELAEWLNSDVDLPDEFRVTNDVVRQWVAWKLLPKAVIVGRDSKGAPIWHRNSDSLTLALRLSQFRKNGLKGKAQLQSRCYLDGWQIELADARIAMNSHIRSLLKSMKKRLTLDYSRIDTDAALTSVQIRALQNQMGTQDARFKGTPFEFSASVASSLNLATLNGHLPSSDIFMTIADALPISGEVKSHWLEYLPIVIAGIAGMAGSPDEIENSLLDNIDNCSDQVFANSRNMVKSIFDVVKDVEFAKVAQLEIGGWTEFIFEQLKQLDCGEWPVLIFAFLCHAQCNSNSILPELPTNFLLGINPQFNSKNA